MAREDERSGELITRSLNRLVVTRGDSQGNTRCQALGEYDRLISLISFLYGKKRTDSSYSISPPWIRAFRLSGLGALCCEYFLVKGFRVVIICASISKMELSLIGNVVPQTPSGAAFPFFLPFLITGTQKRSIASEGMSLLQTPE